MNLLKNIFFNYVVAKLNNQNIFWSTAVSETETIKKIIKNKTTAKSNLKGVVRSE